MNELATFQPGDLAPVQGMPLIAQVNAGNARALQWAQANRDDVERLVQANGALLLRGLKIPGSRDFGVLLSTLFGGELLDYTYRSTPRTELNGKVYTATEYHPDLTIPQHNESAYSNEWAMRIGFFCLLPSDTGGETPISDSRELYRRLPAAIRTRFEERGLTYVRNYSDIDLPWSEVFQTTDRAEVERYCAANGIEAEWIGDNALRTRQRTGVSEVHPVTGERVWFNQAHLFHVSALEPDVRNSLLDVMGEENLPRNVYFGDGGAIDPADLDAIRALYDATKIAFRWEKNDLMLLDNMLFTHGRTPYGGERKVLVGMARPHGRTVALPQAA
ncbi:MAG TPA: TauD/TfdA family dioxygenase [Tahibacter sp.]|nr:TauD/TfdA family dioxygenase [Tahibacter sp.]